MGQLHSLTKARRERRGCGVARTEGREKKQQVSQWMMMILDTGEELPINAFLQLTKWNNQKNKKPSQLASLFMPPSTLVAS